jgi:hypothetical protein
LENEKAAEMVLQLVYLLVELMEYMLVAPKAMLMVDWKAVMLDVLVDKMAEQ